MVKYIMKPYEALPCALETFVVNGIKASIDDFGEGYDTRPDEAEQYGCGCHRFFSKMPSIDVLLKYNITLEEYKEIAEALEAMLYVGSCGWCV